MSVKQLSLLRQIMELQFTAIELNLFLDTHPVDQEALRDIAQVNQRLLQLTADYEAAYGPLFPFTTQPGNVWRWAEEPWPWEITY